MSLFLRGKNSPPDNFYPLAAQGFTIPTNYSGETVTEVTALQISAVMRSEEHTSELQSH